MPSDETIAVVVIDGSRVVREALTAMLNELPDVRAATVTAVEPEFFSDARPQVFVVDMGARERDGWQVVAEVARMAPAAGIVMMGFEPGEHDLTQYLNAGATGFVHCNATFGVLVDTIRSVARGTQVVPDAVIHASAPRDHRTGRHGVAAGPPTRSVYMTPREQEVIDLIADGLDTKQIAKRLGVALPTVKSHVRNVMEKLELHTRLQIAAYSRRGRGG